MRQRLATETEITRHFVRDLTAAGALIVPYVAGRRQPAGYPDRIIWHRQWAGWLELKGYDTPLQLNQRMRIERLNAARPGSAYVFRFSRESAQTPRQWGGWVQSSRGELLSEYVTGAVPLLGALCLLSENR